MTISPKQLSYTKYFILFQKYYMHLSRIQEKVSEFKELEWDDSLSVQVYKILLRQPTQIWMWYWSLRPINLNDSDDREIFLQSASNDLDNFIIQMWNHARSSIIELYKQAVDTLLWE